MLNRLAVRLCAVYALLGNTFADNAVRDSQIALIDPESHPDDERPFIAIYTDDQSDEGLVLSLEIGVTARMSVGDENGKLVIVPGIPPTDAGIELVLDAIERQIHVALADEGNSWAELLRIVMPRLGDPKSIRGASKTRDGERYAGRQIVFAGTPLADPEFGRDLVENGFWFRFLTAAEAEPNLVSVGATIRDLLGAGSGDADWRLAQRALRLSRDAADALGVAPKFGDDVAPITSPEIEGGPAGA